MTPGFHYLLHPRSTLLLSPWNQIKIWWRSKELRQNLIRRPQTEAPTVQWDGLSCLWGLGMLIHAGLYIGHSGASVLEFTPQRIIFPASTGVYCTCACELVLLLPKAGATVEIHQQVLSVTKTESAFLLFRAKRFNWQDKIFQINNLYICSQR